MATAESSLNPKPAAATFDRGRFGWEYFWGALLAVSLPMMVPYLTSLWAIESYRFFPFAFLAVAALLYSRWDRSFRAPRAWLGWAAIACGLVCIVAGVLLATKWLAAVGFVCFAAAWLGSSRGPSDQTLFALSLPLFLIIRLPLGYDQLLVIQLQRITSQLASVFLDLLAIPHAVANNVITLPSRELFVAEACSGIQSVFTLSFIATLLVVYHRRPIWLTPFYLAIAVLLAIAANTTRVTAVAVGEAWFSLDWATGLPHEVIGYLALAVGALLLLSFDQLITAMIHPIDMHSDVPLEENPILRAWNYLLDPDYSAASYQQRDDAPASETRPLHSLWQTAWPRRVFLAVAGLLTLVTAVQAFKMQRPPLITRPTELVFDPPRDLFRDQLDTMQVLGHERMRGNTDPRLGENADIWKLRIEGVDVESEFVLSQPYRGWHELCICYEAGNWNVLNREVYGELDEAETSSGNKDFAPLAVARFKRDPGTYAYLLYSAFDPSGDVLVPPERPGRLGTRFRDLLYGGEQFERDNVMMIQLFVVVPSKLQPELLRSLTDDFVEMRSILIENMRASETKPSHSTAATSGQADRRVAMRGE